MTDRISEVVRNTNETKIRVRVNLDGSGQGTLNTGVPFLDHMIDQIKRSKSTITTRLKTAALPWARPLRKRWGIKEA